ncbi:hypothetical protein KW794_00305 [Candidatus Saccharibacteria bacterium]|nr:hypothetical protein [Candidatus Saccharibacteria bacterium]
MAKNKSSFLKHKKQAVVISAIVFVFVLMPVAALAYVGFVPGVTELMGTNNPVDLGVSYSAADFHRLQQNALFNVSNFGQSDTSVKNIENISSGPQLVIAGANSVQTTATQQELTAFVNMVPWTGTPLSNSQLRFSDGAVEYSGNIGSAYASDLIKSIYPQNDYGQLGFLVRMAGHLHNPAVYVKFGVSVANTSNGPSHGQLSLRVLSLKVNRTDLSNDVNNLNSISLSIPEGDYAQGIAFSLSSLAVSSGQLSFYGTIPSQFSVGSGDSSALCNDNHGSSLVSLDAINGHIGSVLKHCE